MPEHIIPIKTYAIVLVALLVLTATTCAVSFIDMGKMNAVVAVAIAFAKASLVAGLFWLGILIALTMSDFLTREWQ
jgi:cytochrome c oxidase subunit 4